MSLVTNVVELIRWYLGQELFYLTNDDVNCWFSLVTEFSVLRFTEIIKKNGKILYWKRQLKIRVVIFFKHFNSRFVHVPDDNINSVTIEMQLIKCKRMLILVFTDFLHFMFYILKSNWSQLHFAIMKAFHIFCFLWRTYKMQFVVYEGFSSKPVYFRALIKWWENCYTTSLAWTILKIATSLSAYRHFNFPKRFVPLSWFLTYVRKTFAGEAIA